jgi:hypothetical protein
VLVAFAMTGLAAAVHLLWYWLVASTYAVHAVRTPFVILRPR